jgi:tape measure domain-containing protein
MSSIDTRVVELKFNNASFLAGIQTSLSALAGLEQKLKLENASKGISDVSAAASRFNLNPLSSAADAVGSKFSAMSVVAITAIANIASKAVDAGLNIAKSLTIKPVMDGFHEYETNLNSIQTILANTGLEGSAGLAKVNGALDNLNHYSDQTIYNFSEMAKNIGTFTAAGVGLDQSTAAIKGIANLAALSGSNSQQASTAMYQLSQAMAAGKATLVDWNSVVNAGMGGKVFQEALKDTARVQGVAVDDIIKKNGSFRDSLQEGWLTTSVLTDTLSKFTGDLTADQLKSMGYTQEQIVAIQKMGATATRAATEVKTVSQLMGTLQEAVGSGWSQSFKLIFGNFDEARELFTNVNNVLGGMVQSSADARNKVLGDWNAMGGRTVLIEAISNAFHALIAVLKPVKDAFREIFPAKTGQDLYNMTVALRDFTEKLKIGDETAANLKRTFAGVFAVFDILRMFIGSGIKMFAELFSSMSGGAGSILNFTGGIGDMLVALRNAIRDGDLFINFWALVGHAIHSVIDVIKSVVGFIGNLFSGFDKGSADQLTGALGAVGDSLNPIQRAFEKVKDFFSNLGGMLVRAGTAIGTAMSGVGQSIGAALGNIDWNLALGTVRTGLLAAIVLMIKKLFAGGLNVDVGGGLFDKIKGTLDGVTNSLTAMQTNLKADTLLKIAAAIALLAGAILLMSTIDSADMAKSLISLGIAYGALQLALIGLSKAVGFMGTLKLPILAASILILAASLVVLALAMKLMSSISGEDLLRGLFGMGAGLLIISQTMKLMPQKQMIANATGILILSSALIVLGIALKVFASMSWGEMAKGMVGLAGALVIIGLALNLMPANMLLTSVGLIAVGAALILIGGAMKIFGSMSMEEIAKGLIAIAGALLIIAAALILMPPNMLAQAVGLIAVGVALNLIGAALRVMAGMSWEEIAKGLVVLAGSLLILSVALIAMTGTLPGAAALLVASAALAIFTPVMIALGSLSWQTIVTGLLAMAGIFVVLGAAGYLLAPVVPVIIGLAAALVLIGAGLALAGVGAVLFATAFATVVSVGAAGVAVLAGILGTFIASIPQAMAAFGRGIIELANIIATGGPAFVRAFSAVLQSILQAIIINTPLIGQAFLTLVDTALRVVVTATPRIAQAGLQLIISMIQLMSANVGRIVSVASDLIVNFLNGISANLGRVIDAGVNLVISFINGVANAIRSRSGEMGEAGANLGLAIVEGMAKGIAGGASRVISAAAGVARNAIGAAMGALGIHSPSKEFHKIGMWSDEGFALGLKDYGHLVDKSAVGVGESAVGSLKSTLGNFSNALAGDMTFNPVITPVLDLSEVKKDSGRIGGLLSTGPRLENQAWSDARAANNGFVQNYIDRNAPDVLPGSAAPLTFVQNNMSPKELSPIDLYRQTRNQLSIARGALNR